jgi:hypothetical protein
MRSRTLQNILKCYHAKDIQSAGFLFFCVCGMMIYMTGGYAMQSTLYCAEKCKKDSRILRKEDKNVRVILKTDIKKYVVVVVTLWA